MMERSLLLGRRVLFYKLISNKLKYMKEIRWGFIGCGEVVELKSGPAFDMIAGSSVAAVMSRSKEKAASYAQRHSINKYYNDVYDLIADDDVNAVYIATPPSSHATYAIMAMRAGKPVYIEKPMASTYEDCIRINRVSEDTGMPCFVAYYRRYLPYFNTVGKLLQDRAIGNVCNVSIRFSASPRNNDTSKGSIPWRLQPEIAGAGYFYDLAPHQIDILQHYFGVITRAHGYPSNRAGLYNVEDTVSASFAFENGLTGSGTWCFVGHESAKEDRIEIIGTDGMIEFSVFSYKPIRLVNSEGERILDVKNPPYVQLPLIKSVVETLQGTGSCLCTNISATPVNWVLDRILWKI